MGCWKALRGTGHAESQYTVYLAGLHSSLVQGEAASEEGALCRERSEA